MAVYIAVNGQTSGPFDRAALLGMVASGALNGSTMVWQQGMAGWLPASEVANVAALLGAGPRGGGAQGFDPAAFVIGNWRVDGAQVPVDGVGMGRLFATLSYSSDGRFRMEGRLDVNAQGIPITVNVTMEGTYTIRKLSETSFMMTPNGQMTMTIPGFPPETQAATEPDTYIVVDRDLMRDASGTELRRVR